MSLSQYCAIPSLQRLGLLLVPSLEEFISSTFCLRRALQILPPPSTCAIISSDCLLFVLDILSHGKVLLVGTLMTCGFHLFGGNTQWATGSFHHRTLEL